MVVPHWCHCLIACDLLNPELSFSAWIISSANKDISSPLPLIVLLFSTQSAGHLLKSAYSGCGPELRLWVMNKWKAEMYGQSMVFLSLCFCWEIQIPTRHIHTHAQSPIFIHENERANCSLDLKLWLWVNKKQNYMVSLWFACLTVLTKKPPVFLSFSHHLFLLRFLTPTLTHSPLQVPGLASGKALSQNALIK